MSEQHGPGQPDRLGPRDERHAEPPHDELDVATHTPTPGLGPEEPAGEIPLDPAVDGAPRGDRADEPTEDIERG